MKNNKTLTLSDGRVICADYACECDCELFHRNCLVPTHENKLPNSNKNDKIKV